MDPSRRTTTVTVVTPVFNGEKYIRKTIESVLAQDYASIEYLVVDGASTDRTMQIVSEYEGKISTIISEPDRGMYHAINKGFARATGDILCYLNGDDTYLPGTIEKVVRCFAERAIDLCFGDCIYVGAEDQELFRYEGVELSYHGVARLGRIPFAQQTAFWTKALFHRVGGFDESYRYVADTKFFFECLRHVQTRRLHIPDYLATFRLHDEGFSRKAAAEMRDEHRRALRELAIRPGLSRFAYEALVKWRNRKNLAMKVLRNTVLFEKWTRCR
jgi:glycosyltransferase involved in cell wall biosynthesis